MSELSEYSEKQLTRAAATLLVWKWIELTMAIAASMTLALNVRRWYARIPTDSIKNQGFQPIETT